MWLGSYNQSLNHNVNWFVHLTQVTLTNRARGLIVPRLKFIDVGHVRNNFSRSISVVI